ncbi:chemotaxis protein CheA [Psychrobium sp. nBUS_13]|uniref:chemotaxis protein CheA n=1 Tax=Psychrobium sp. nBUS_13 TaxID=3395319 RepID=UPI003EBB37E0
MSFDVDEDILQDFLIEAGEILELLQEQLVELENNPDDADLLNAIFRGFHTIKGGAGFMGLKELVDVCHGAENIFDLLRTNQRSVTPELMDVILEGLDTVNDMFQLVQAREPLIPAEPRLLEELARLSHPEGAGSQASEPEPEPEPEPEISAGGDEITDEEFETLLDDLHGANGSVTNDSPANETVQTNGSDDITDDEFEALLDELHGAKGQPKTASAAVGASNEITDDEFEAFLDELHGKKGAPSPVENAVSKASEPTTTAPASDEIDDAEFEALLDELHAAKNSDSANAKPASEAKKAAPVKNKVSTPKAAPKKAAAVPAKANEANKTAASKKAAAPAAQAETTVRVDTARLDDIMNMVGELVLVRNRLVSLGLTSGDEEMSKAVANLDNVTADLQGSVMKTRMQPIKKVFGRFPRVVRDMARSLKKDITLTMEGEDTDLDKNLVEALADPLVHLVRNSVDHGIEMPDDREAAGKPRNGTVILSASQEGDHILLSIKDDGAGMDADKLKSIAISRGVLDEETAARMSDEDAYELIFAPGFSTKTEISDISGRGVGMDVVKTKITQLNGTVKISSEKGVGTVLKITVPLTLAIMPTLMVQLDQQIFALPLAAVNEIFNLDLTKTNIVDGRKTISVRNRAIPLFYLDEWLSKDYIPGKDRTEGHVVIVQIGPQTVGFVVDGLIGQEEVVIKPLGALLHGTPGISGATITSDGSIALIVDIGNLLKRYA